jgi:hypothetical protein
VSVAVAVVQAYLKKCPDALNAKYDQLVTDGKIKHYPAAVQAKEGRTCSTKIA